MAEKPPAESWVAVEDVASENPSKLWFQRSVGALRGGTYVASAQEMVKAPTLDAAHEDWSVSTEHMQDLVLRSDFVFPEPPIDEASGCRLDAAAEERDGLLQGLNGSHVTSCILSSPKEMQLVT